MIDGTGVLGKNLKKMVVAGRVGPIVMGDYLYYGSDLRGTPLSEGGATVIFNIGHNRFHFLTVDGVGNFGSRQDPYLALAQNGGGKGLIYGGGSLRELNDSFTALCLHQGLVARGELKKFMRKRKKY